MLAGDKEKYAQRLKAGGDVERLNGSDRRTI